jgi:hypothetical protein
MQKPRNLKFSSLETTGYVDSNLKAQYKGPRTITMRASARASAIAASPNPPPTNEIADSHLKNTSMLEVHPLCWIKHPTNIPQK